jgi:hypothetical protein
MAVKVVTKTLRQTIGNAGIITGRQATTRHRPTDRVQVPGAGDITEQQPQRFADEKEKLSGQ